MIFFILILAHLVYIFDAHNMLNKNLQGKDLTVCEFIDKVKAFLAKLRLWRGNICLGTFSMFSTVTEFLCQNPQIETTRLSELVTEHLTKSEKEIGGYFSSLGEDEVAYLRNPFTANAQTLQAGTGMQEELIELQHDGFATMCTLRKIWEILVYDVQFEQKNCGTCYSSIVVVSINMVV